MAVTTQTQRCHPRLQRGGGAADAVRAAVSGARCAASRYEIVFVNDGSKDRSVALLREQFERAAARNAGGAVPCELRPALGGHGGPFVRARRVRRHAGCGSAESAGGDRQAGRRCSIRGYDYVGTIRQQRQDSWWRRWFSKRINKLRERITPVRITDQGCMMRGYARSVVTALNQTREINTFIPALASLVRDEARSRCRSRTRSASPAVEVFDVQPDPPEFRPDHRLLGGAAAAVLHGRHVISLDRRCCSSFSWCAESGWARKPKACSPCSPLCSSSSVWRCSASACWANTWAHLRASSRASALHCRGGAGG